MQRRRFLRGSAGGLVSLLAASGWDARSSRGASPWSRRDGVGSELSADVVIVGGGLGGCAGALAALRAGRTVILTEPTDWVGGQLTSQAVPPDEHPWIERFGRNASYARLREGIRAYYRRSYPLSETAANDPYLDPGAGSVSALCHEPRVALAVLTELLAPHASGGRLTVLLEHELVGARLGESADILRSVSVRDRRTGDLRELVAPYFLDATELGDLLPLAGVEHVTGFEAKGETGDRAAPETAEPLNQQAITVCFAAEYREGEDHRGDPPADYAFWKGYVPELRPAWPGPLLSLTYTQPVRMEPITARFDPTGKGEGLWVYRRIAHPSNFRPGTYRGGITLVNWPQNDYWLGPLVGPGVSAEEAAKHVEGARRLSLSLLHWLQTECPRADGGAGWPGLRLRPDLMGTSEGLAKAPYIRESRRIRAEFTVTEAMVGTEARAEALKLSKDDPRLTAERFEDAVGVGSYRIDLHPSTGGNNYIDVSSLPFQIPLGALLPLRVENILPACKNLGVTHVTNGCYRLHPVEWAIGEAAGALAAFCLEKKEKPRSVRNRPELLREFQGALMAAGVEIEWPRVTPR